MKDRRLHPAVMAGLALGIIGQGLRHLGMPHGIVIGCLLIAILLMVAGGVRTSRRGA